MQYIVEGLVTMLSLNPTTNTKQGSDDGKTPNEIEQFNDSININTLPIYTRSQLALFNGIDKQETYVAIRGYIYDVSVNISNYGPGGAYHRLVGKDVSRLLGLNQLQLKPTNGPHATLLNRTWYTEDFTDKENGIVDKWVLFFQKRYKIVGMVVDHECRS